MSNELTERLENIEATLFALQVNAASSASESFEGPETESESEIETRSLSVAPSLSTELEAYIDGLGLRYFRGSELTPYWSRTCGNVRNSAPPRTLWNNIAPTLAVLDRLRDEIGAAISITSSYRDADYNACVGGVANSQHKKFTAIDFVARRGTPSSWAAKLRSYRGQQFTWNGGNFEFHGGIGTYSTFVHIDTRGWDANW
ncbi:MAG: D-Ala-D-Ala carboxypeptidase family metallohydrolase [Xenococcaceae cyanobacterium MO_167.B27]|nr:D-Ala-D-Ala carboxypeptidase family metallohydrolase [Xenococcaceae cyanobacterium MO_167.B27]